MAETGLWNIAQQQPGRTAVITPDGRAVGYGELAATADRYGRGLQAMGLQISSYLLACLPYAMCLAILVLTHWMTGRSTHMPESLKNVFDTGRSG